MRVDFTVQCRIRWGSSEPRASSVCHEWWRRLAPLSPCTGARYLVIYLTRCRGDEDFVFIFLAVEGWTSHPSAVDLFVFNFLTLFRCSLWRFIPNGNVSLLLAARHCARCSHRQGPGQVRIDFIRKTLRRVDRWKALGKFKNVSIRASIYLAFRLIAEYVFLLASFKVRSSMNTSLCRGIRFQFTLPTL